MLCNLMPYPPHGGLQLRLFNMLMRIAQHHEVTLACHIWDPWELEGAAWLADHGIQTLTAPLTAMTWRHVRPSISGYLFHGQPPEVAQFQSQELRRKIAQQRFDIVQIEETTLAPYCDLQPDAKKVITFHNMHHLQEQRIADIAPPGIGRAWRKFNARVMRRYEPRICAAFDRRITVSEDDRAALARAGNTLPVDVLPNGVDTSRLTSLPLPERPRALIFVGTLNYLPCTDAAIWLAQEIAPRLRAQSPDLELWIVGRNPPADVVALSRPGVYVTGAVPDVKPYYERAAIACVPLRAGGGSRLKILEAMALGRPVVSTTIGAEGLAVTHGENILIADDADTFAAAVQQLLDSPEQAARMTANARQLVQERYDWDAIAARQLQIYDELAGG